MRASTRGRAQPGHAVWCCITRDEVVSFPRARVAARARSALPHDCLRLGYAFATKPTSSWKAESNSSHMTTFSKAAACAARPSSLVSSMLVTPRMLRAAGEIDVHARALAARAAVLMSSGTLPKDLTRAIASSVVPKKKPFSSSSCSKNLPASMCSD